MTIANNNLKQFKQYKTEQQQNDQHKVKDRGRTVGYTEKPVTGKVQTRDKKKKKATWKHSQADTSRTAPFEMDTARPTSTKMVTWKTLIIDLATLSPAESGVQVEDVYNTVQSKYNKMFKGHMQPNPCIRHHPAYETLFEYTTEGCPVDCGESWLQEQLEAAIHRGNHMSVQKLQAAKCLHEEALEKVEQGSA